LKKVLNNKNPPEAGFYYERKKFISS